MTSVLIVDHEADCASQLAEELFISGFSTRSARSGHEALQVVSGFVPDVAFIRLVMPDLNGFELARQLELDPALSKCRFVAMTVHDCPEFEQCAKVVQFVRILKAPVKCDAILATIADLLETAGQKTG